ncbi:unnamed protein product [Ixodes pacificus]
MRSPLFHHERVWCRVAKLAWLAQSHRAPAEKTSAESAGALEKELCPGTPSQRHLVYAKPSATRRWLAPTTAGLRRDSKRRRQTKRKEITRRSYTKGVAGRW